MNYHRFILLIGAIWLCCTLCAKVGSDITVLQWNVWQEGTMVPGGEDAIVNELVRLQPDFVTLSEVRNYHGTDFMRKLTHRLQQRGVTYYTFSTYDTGLLSRYPITDSLTVFPCIDDHGSIYRLLCQAKGKKIAVYTAHLDYLNDTYYEVRGYDGNNWQPMVPLTDTLEIKRRNGLSKREEAIKRMLVQAQKDEAADYNVILGGDFNEPSLYDWTDRTRYLYDHHGVVLAWPVSKMLHDAGFTDAYRAIHRDELVHPGFTFPADNLAVSPQRLSWTPLADERERIDYVHVKGKHLQVIDAQLFGPKACIAYARRGAEVGNDPIILPLDVWPSDHRGVWVKLRVK